jgi:hypothetical protein
MDASERSLLQGTVREAVASAPPNDRAAVDKILAELGWFEMLRAEPHDAVAIVFDALGTTNAAASVLDDVVIEGLGVEARADLAVLLPPFRSRSAPGRLDGGRVSASGLASARIAGASEALIVSHAGTELAAFCVSTAGLEVSTVRGVDPEAGLHRVRVERQPANPIPLDTQAWDAAVASARVAIGHQIAGACRAMLDLARGHALERVQFGSPIARFQAVRHRLADALVAVEALDAGLTAAAGEPGSMTAALAKALAGRTARTVSSHCQQVLAGIGFTTDHPFHRFLKRTMTLDGLFGSADEITLELGRQLLAIRRVPTLIEL